MRRSRKFHGHGLHVLELAEDPPVSGRYLALNENGTHCPMYLPSHDDISRQCEIFRRETLFRKITGDGPSIGECGGNGGSREYWTSDIYRRRVVTFEPVDLFDNEYWNQRQQ